MVQNAHHLCFIRKEARVRKESWTMINGRGKGLGSLDEATLAGEKELG